MLRRALQSAWRQTQTCRRMRAAETWDTPAGVSRQAVGIGQITGSKCQVQTYACTKWNVIHGKIVNNEGSIPCCKASGNQRPPASRRPNGARNTHLSAPRAPCHCSAQWLRADGQMHKTKGVENRGFRQIFTFVLRRSKIVAEKSTRKSLSLDFENES